MGGTTSTPAPQKQQTEKKLEQSNEETMKQEAITRAMQAQMNLVCARIQPLNAKPAAQKGPRLPT
jgi:hypothetical protein